MISLLPFIGVGLYLVFTIAGIYFSDSRPNSTLGLYLLFFGFISVPTFLMLYVALTGVSQ